MATRATVTGPENAPAVMRSALSGIVVTGIMRYVLFLAILGVVASGVVLDIESQVANPAGQAFAAVLGDADAWNRRFGALAERMHVSDPRRAARAAVARPVTFIAFDLLRLLGQDLVDQPWSTRRALLEQLDLDGPRCQVPPTHDDGDGLLEVISADSGSDQISVLPGRDDGGFGLAMALSLAGAALITLKAKGTLDDSNIACKVETGRALATAGLHPATGGSGLELCSGDMLLEALVACAGVTLKAVSTALAIPLKSGTVSAEGDLDFRGTLGVDKEAPVGFRQIRLRFDVDTDVPQDKLDQLLKLTERYCVVYQTIAKGPPVDIKLSRV